MRISSSLARFGVESKPVSMTIFATLGTGALLASFVFMMISWIYAKNKFVDTEFRLKWNKTQPGYLFHLLSSSGEWIAINAFSGVLVCLSRRMKLFTDWNVVKFFH